MQYYFLIKENFTENNAGAASIWVKDYLKRSKLKKRSIVYGNLEDNSKPLLNNFKNLKIGSSFVKKNISYTDKLYKNILNIILKLLKYIIDLVTTLSNQKKS